VRRLSVLAAVAVAAGSVSGAGYAGTAQAAASCGTGPYQRVVEQYLAAHPAYGRVKVDGKQSAADCAAIRRFQGRFGISPVEGYAGATTRSVVNRLTSAAVHRCDTGTRVCVDLTSQTMWFVRSGKVVLGPTTIRTGRKGMRTPTGKFAIGTKKTMTTSSYYGTKMPYWEQFYRDMGFHQTPSYLYTGPGSHGCINLLRADAIKLYDLTNRGTAVYISGRKPGT
jgi:lipoprotein-anchoring transpeptidase ErfK/SrfK